MISVTYNIPKKKFLIFHLLVFLFLSDLGFSQNIHRAHNNENEGNTAQERVTKNKAQKLTDEGLLLLNQGFFNDSRKLFLESISMDPDNYQPYLELGMMYLWEGVNALAILYLEKSNQLLKNYEKNQNFDRSQSKQYTQDHNRALRLLAAAYLQENRLQTAEDILLPLTQDETQARDFGQYAWLLFKMHRLKEAENKALRGLELDEYDFSSRNTLAIVYSHQKRYDEALRQYNILASYFANNPVVLNNMAEALVSTFDYQESENKFLQSLYNSQNHDTALTHINLAHLYMDRLQINGAKAILQSYSGKQDWGFYLLALVRVAFMEGDLIEALRLLDEIDASRQTYGHIGWVESNYEFLLAFWRSRIYQAMFIIYQSAPGESIIEDIHFFSRKLIYRFFHWWQTGRALRILSDDQKLQQDLYIHASDNTFIYPEMSEYVARFPHSGIRKHISRLSKKDKRQEAQIFYLQWLSEIDWLNGNGPRASINHYRADELIQFNKFPLLYLQMLRQRAVYRNDSNAALRLYGVMPSYAFYYQIKIPLQISSNFLTENKWNQLISQSAFFRHPANDENPILISITFKNTDTEEGFLEKKDIIKIQIDEKDNLFDQSQKIAFSLKNTNPERLAKHVLWRYGKIKYAIKTPI